MTTTERYVRSRADQLAIPLALIRATRQDDPRQVCVRIDTCIRNRLESLARTYARLRLTRWWSLLTWAESPTVVTLHECAPSNLHWPPHETPKFGKVWLGLVDLERVDFIHDCSLSRNAYVVCIEPRALSQSLSSQDAILRMINEKALNDGVYRRIDALQEIARAVGMNESNCGWPLPDVQTELDKANSEAEAIRIANGW